MTIDKALGALTIACGLLSITIFGLATAVGVGRIKTHDGDKSMKKSELTEKVKIIFSESLLVIVQGKTVIIEEVEDVSYHRLQELSILLRTEWIDVERDSNEGTGGGIGSNKVVASHVGLIIEDDEQKRKEKE